MLRYFSTVFGIFDFVVSLMKPEYLGVLMRHLKTIVIFIAATFDISFSIFASTGCHVNLVSFLFSKYHVFC